MRTELDSVKLDAHIEREETDGERETVPMDLTEREYEMLQTALRAPCFSAAFVALADKFALWWESGHE